MSGPLQNLRHERFCREYASGETLASAYIRAGFKDSPNARYNGSRLRNTPACRERINELMGQFAEQAALKVEYLQAQLLPALRANPQDLFDEAGDLRPVTALQREFASAIKAIKFDRKTGKVTEIVLADKIAAAGLLLKSIGAIQDDEGKIILTLLNKRVAEWSDDEYRMVEARLSALALEAPEQAKDRD
jgi:phage terminase small subunit